MSNNAPIKGRIHSVETCGAVDGPGLRYVIFFQGCNMRCLYCHNPCARDIEGGTEATVEELIEDIKKYVPFMKASNGGVTLSGGEPLLQPKFAKELLRRCHQLGIHTVLDTNGCFDVDKVKDILEYVDLVLLDIKSYEPITHKKVCGVSKDPVYSFASYLNEIKKDVWVKFVLVPDLTDAEENIEGIANFVSGLNNIKKIEILPFHKLGEYKWKKLGYKYELYDTPQATDEMVEKAKKIFKKYNLISE
jgi:pyruvate formate lyase activating enzyme